MRARVAGLSAVGLAALWAGAPAATAQVASSLGPPCRTPSGSSTWCTPRSTSGSAIWWTRAWHVRQVVCRPHDERE